MLSQVKLPYNTASALLGFFPKAGATRAVKQLLWQRKSLGLMRQGRNGVAVVFPEAGNEGVSRATIIFPSFPSSFFPYLQAGDSKGLENGYRMPGRVSPLLYRAGTCHLSVSPTHSGNFLPQCTRSSCPPDIRCINPGPYADFSE